MVSARSAMTALDHLHFFRDPARYAEQVWIIQGLQDFAYFDADNGCISDIAEHCQASWLRVLRNYPESVDTLAGKYFFNYFSPESVLYLKDNTVITIFMHSS